MKQQRSSNTKIIILGLRVPTEGFGRTAHKDYPRQQLHVDGGCCCTCWWSDISQIYSFKYSPAPSCKFNIRYILHFSAKDEIKKIFWVTPAEVGRRGEDTRAGRHHDKGLTPTVCLLALQFSKDVLSAVDLKIRWTDSGQLKAISSIVYIFAWQFFRWIKVKGR